MMKAAPLVSDCAPGGASIGRPHVGKNRASTRQRGFRQEGLYGFWSIAVAFLAVFMLTACEQNEVRYRVRWSPDGNKALVVASDGLHLSNRDGEISPVIMKESYPVAWMPDSSRFVACRHKEVRDWVTVQKYLNKNEQTIVIDSAKKLRPILLAHKGDWEHWSEAEEAQLKAINLTFSDAVMVYLRDNDNGALKKKLGEKVPEYLQGAVKIDLLEIYRVDGQTSQLEKLAYETAGAIKEVRVSPNGAAIAIVEDIKTESGDPISILKAWLVNGDLKLVASSVARFPDWSADSRSVVFVERAVVSPQSVAGKLCRRRIFDDQDKPLKELLEKQDLASTVFNEYARVRCLKDGRTIFSSAELKIPSAFDSQSQRAWLFALDPRYSNVVSMIPDRLRYAIGAQCEWFDASPDGQRLAVLSETGLVHVLEIASGRMTEAQTRELDADTYRRSAFMPEWRNDDEITFAGPAAKAEGSKRIAEVFLYSVTRDKGASISDKWPSGARSFLDQPEKENGPSQEPPNVPKPQ